MGHFSGVSGLWPTSWVEDSLPLKLFWANVSLAVFNLLPAFPMGGGRMLRAVLALRMDHVRATQIAANIGQGLALWLGLLGLFFNPLLLFIALFVWIGAAEETMSEQMKSALGDVPVSRAMITDFQTALRKHGDGRHETPRARGREPKNLEWSNT